MSRRSLRRVHRWGDEQQEMNSMSPRVVTALHALRRRLLSQQWFTSAVLPAIPRPVRWTLRKLYFLPSDLIDRVIGHREEMIPPKSMIFTGSVDDFKSSGEALVHRLVNFGEIGRAHVCTPVTSLSRMPSSA